MTRLGSQGGEKISPIVLLLDGQDVDLEGLEGFTAKSLQTLGIFFKKAVDGAGGHG